MNNFADTDSRIASHRALVRHFVKQDFIPSLLFIKDVTFARKDIMVGGYGEVRVGSIVVDGVTTAVAIKRLKCELKDILKHRVVHNSPTPFLVCHSRPLRNFGKRQQPGIPSNIQI